MRPSRTLKRALIDLKTDTCCLAARDVLKWPRSVLSPIGQVPADVDKHAAVLRHCLAREALSSWPVEIESWFLGNAAKGVDLAGRMPLEALRKSIVTVGSQSQ